MNYLSSSAVTSRANLDILLNTRVVKLTYKSGSSVAASGVTLQQTNSGTQYNITAAKEVILSAGTIASAQLLLLSGIGPSAALQAKGIPVKYNNANVGANLIVRTPPSFCRWFCSRRALFGSLGSSLDREVRWNGAREVVEYYLLSNSANIKWTLRTLLTRWTSTPPISTNSSHFMKQTRVVCFGFLFAYLNLY